MRHVGLCVDDLQDSENESTSLRIPLPDFLEHQSTRMMEVLCSNAGKSPMRDLSRLHPSRPARRQKTFLGVFLLDYFSDGTCQVCTIFFKWTLQIETWSSSTHFQLVLGDSVQSLLARPCEWLVKAKRQGQFWLLYLLAGTVGSSINQRHGPRAKKLRFWDRPPAMSSRPAMKHGHLSGCRFMSFQASLSFNQFSPSMLFIFSFEATPSSLQKSCRPPVPRSSENIAHPQELPCAQAVHEEGNWGSAAGKVQDIPAPCLHQCQFVVG